MLNGNTFLKMYVINTNNKTINEINKSGTGISVYARSKPNPNKSNNIITFIYVNISPNPAPAKKNLNKKILTGQNLS